MFLWSQQRCYHCTFVPLGEHLYVLIAIEQKKALTRFSLHS